MLTGQVKRQGWPVTLAGRKKVVHWDHRLSTGSVSTPQGCRDLSAGCSVLYHIVRELRSQVNPGRQYREIGPA